MAAQGSQSESLAAGNRPLPPPTWRMRLRRALRWPSAASWQRGTEVLLWVGAAVALVLTAIQTLAYNRSVLEGTPESTPSGEVALLFCGLMLAVALATGRRLRSRWLRMVLPSAAVLAGTTLILGVATYAPCPSEVPVVGHLGWILELFVGGVEGPPSPGAPCAEAGAPGFAVARALGLLATFIGAVGAGLIAARGPFDQLRATLSGDVDVVVGLDPSGVELVSALLVENRQRPRREPWIESRPRWLHKEAPPAPTPERAWDVDPGDAKGAEKGIGPPNNLMNVREAVTGGHPHDRPRWMLRRPHVVVVVADPGNSLIEAARDMGAIVLVSDPTEAGTLRGLLTRCSPVRPRTPRVALRRMFVISSSTQFNQQVAQAAQLAIQPEFLPHRQGVVPRILVRFDDAWQGWAFRNASLIRHRWVLDTRPQIGHAVAPDGGMPGPEYLAVPSAPSGQPIVDGITPMDLVSQQLVEEMIPRHDPGTEQLGRRGWRVRRIVLVGDSPAWFTLLNEVQWQVWTRFEVASVVEKRRQEKLASLAALASGAQPPSSTGVCRLKADPNLGTSAPPTEVNDIDAFIDAADWSQTQLLAAQDAEDPQADLAAWREAIGGRLRDRVNKAREDVSRSQRMVTAAGTGPVVLLSGSHARERVEEWRTTAAPWRMNMGGVPSAAQVEVCATDRPLHDLLKGGLQAVVLMDGTADQKDQARHLARTHDADIVALFDPEAVGLMRPATAGAPYLFGPSFTRTLPGCSRRLPALDSMSRVAEQQHSVYSGTWLAKGGDPWQTDRTDREGTGKVTAGQPWSRLPDFYREDNVRQLWHVLQWFALNGWEWSAAADRGPARPIDDEVLWESLARSEYHRWVELRRRNGWRAPREGEKRNDFLRIHQDMAQMGDRTFNEGLVRQIVDRFWSIGLAPRRLTRLARTGEVSGQPATTRTLWTALDSGLVFSAEPGDWRIGNPPDERYVTPEVAEQLYAVVSESSGGSSAGGTPGQGSFRLSRVAPGAPTTLGRRADTREVVESPEGTVIAEPGDWIITQRVRRAGRDGFDRWPISEAHRIEGYRELEDEWHMAPPAAGAGGTGRVSDSGCRLLRRRGLVTARRLSEPFEWKTTIGDVLHGEAGDWWVEGPDGVVRTVTDTEFRGSYEAIAEDRFRRIGTVTARRALVAEDLATLEGPARALPGMWVVTGPNGNIWPVPDDVFREGYEEI